MKLSNCNDSEIALKSFFLGPQSENSDWLRQQILTILDHWFQWRKDLHAEDGRAISRSDQKLESFKELNKNTQDLVMQLCERFETEIPQFSPRYIGHMYSEITIPAILGHFIALLHNPNNISTEAARVGAIIEDEAIKDLANMLGFKKELASGHFTSGGTVANIEALWRARYRLAQFLSLGAYLNLNFNSKLSYTQAALMGVDKYNYYLKKYDINESLLKEYNYISGNTWSVFELFNRAFGKLFKGPVVLIPNSKHYSWLKAVSLLGIGESNLWSIDLDCFGAMDIDDLELKVNKAISEDRPIMMIVSVAGTTELGQCDKIDKINELLNDLKTNHEMEIWHHVDAAYGGYFTNVLEENILTKEVHDAFSSIKGVHSVTIDPHKLGYIPYACGAIIVSNKANYEVSTFEAKYIKSPNENIDRWMKTLEGSRSASGACATWMSSNAIGFGMKGYGQILKRTILSKRTLEFEILQHCPHIRILENMHLNLLGIVYLNDNKKLSILNESTKTLINYINAGNEFVVSSTDLKSPEYKVLIDYNCKKWNIEIDDTKLSVLRITLMNPFFLTKETKTSFLSSFINLIKDYSPSVQ